MNQVMFPLRYHRYALCQVKSLRELDQNHMRLDGGVHPVKTPFSLTMVVQLENPIVIPKPLCIFFELFLFQIAIKLLNGLTLDRSRLSFAAVLK